ncbi:MATE family efflux transporter [Algicola sagamiensis]|uniref:MATE family efflux transporter n=1 Tax=Algicola sagamiensis TaxID=163869 RepID=UPI00037BFDEF|nr:MATE family efflux transporter [Algicola sagamiensis]
MHASLFEQCHQRSTFTVCLIILRFQVKFSQYEAKQLLKLATPIFLAQITQVMMNVVDSMMAGGVSPIDMAALAIGSSIWMPVVIATSALLSAMISLISHHYGAKDHDKVTQTVIQGFYAAIFLLVVSSILFIWKNDFLALVDMEDKTRQLASEYLDYVFWGLPAAYGFTLLRYLSEGIGFTKPTMVISFIGILVNIPANYILIYGKFGVPAMGGAGCGLATTIVTYTMFISMLIYTQISPRLNKYQFLKNWQKPVREIQSQIFRIGTPIAFAVLFEVALFCCIPILIAPLGADIVASHLIAANFSTLVYMIPMSLSLATTIRVGYYIGRDEMDKMRNAVLSSFTCAVIISAIVIFLTILLRKPIAELYTNDQNVILLAGSLLIIACFYQLSDSIQVIATAVLRGLKRTQSVFYITFVAYWPIGFCLGYGLGLTTYFVAEPLGAKGFWIGIVVGLTVAAVLLSWQLRRILKEPEFAIQQETIERT